MEEPADGRCNVVYYCASAGEDISAVYESQNPPSRSENGGNRTSAIETIHGNVRILLDEDQGGFNEGMCVDAGKW
jgi:hypothetical protein